MMLLLKALCCTVFCFGMIQAASAECCKDVNALLKKVLESNMSNGAKLEQVNKILQNGLLGPATDGNSAKDELPVNTTPQYEIWKPWVPVIKSKFSPAWHEQKPRVAWDPWSSMQLSQQNSEPKRFQLPLPSWNPSDLEDSQLNSYRNPYQPISYNPDQINNVNLQNSMYHNDKFRPGYGTLQTGMYPSYSGQFQMPGLSEIEPSMLRNYPLKQNMPNNLYPSK